MPLRTVKLTEQVKPDSKHSSQKPLANKRPRKLLGVRKAASLLLPARQGVRWGSVEKGLRAQPRLPRAQQGGRAGRVPAAQVVSAGGSEWEPEVPSPPSRLPRPSQAEGCCRKGLFSLHGEAPAWCAQASAWQCQAADGELPGLGQPVHRTLPERKAVARGPQAGSPPPKGPQPRSRAQSPPRSAAGGLSCAGRRGRLLGSTSARIIAVSPALSTRMQLLERRRRSRPRARAKRRATLSEHTRQPPQLHGGGAGRQAGKGGAPCQRGALSAAVGGPGSPGRGVRPELLPIPPPEWSPRCWAGE